jgi:cytochrome P450 family 138
MTTVRLPPGPPHPRFVQGIYALTAPYRGVRGMRARYGDAFTVNVPIIGRAVMISDPVEVRQLFRASPDVVENLEQNLGRVLGPRSLFALTGDEHRKQRKLLVPPFHGRRLAAYARIVEEETARETASWPEGVPFGCIQPMMRITINVILRAVFGAEGEDLAELRERLPAGVALGARLAVMPVPDIGLGAWSPWGRLRAMRRTYNAIIDRLVAKAEGDPRLGERDDILAMMVQARYDDGTRMTNAEIADELLTLLTAGHETTATTLAWAVERLRRHPDVLRDLAAEADGDGSALREAVITEVQRTRPVIDMVGRQVLAESYELGRWTLPRGTTVLVSIALIHENETLFPDPFSFRPARFLDTRPDLQSWIPFGGGTRRCIGAAFANMEMHAALRTMLRSFTLEPTTEPNERWRSRGIASAPAKGGVAVVYRRQPRRDSPGAASVAERNTSVARN